MTTNLVQKSSIFFSCEKCNYTTCRKSQYDRHLTTLKHTNTTNTTNLVQKGSGKNTCQTCNKIYKHHSSLWNHKKTCTIIENSENNQNNNQENNNQDIEKKDELINYLMKENQDFKNLILEIVKKDTYNNNNNIINTNSHNKTFNLQFFLNETCKDAMNIMDFVDSLKIQLTDLENVGKLGFVDGISKIIVQNLNSLEENMRPVHCTDTKREVMYVKDDNKWEKENEDKQKMRKVIKHVTHKNSKLFKEFKTKYPGCEKSDSKYSDKYDKLIIEAMGGKGDNDLEKEDKIIKNIAKVVVIDK
jgi:hypothetical protein